MVKRDIAARFDDSRPTSGGAQPSSDGGAGREHGQGSGPAEISEETPQAANVALHPCVGELSGASPDPKNLLESIQIAILFLDNDLRLGSFTSACSEVFHLAQTDIGRPFAQIASRIDYPDLQDDLQRVLWSLGRVERQVSAREDDRRFMVRVLPHRNLDNSIAGVVATFLEITDFTRAEAALHATERRFGEAQQLAGIGVWESDLDGEDSWWSPVVYQLWGVPAADKPPPPHARPIHPQDRAGYEAAWAGVRETGELNVEWRIVLPDHSIRWLASIGRMERCDRGRRVLGIVQDVTARKRTENRLLLGELQHRVRNILAVVRSIVSRSVRSAADVEDLARHLDGRLGALARTQSIFTRSAEGGIELEDLVRDEMVSVAAREDQFTVHGPTIRLKRNAAETLALALHELTTNAVKYGALGRADGRVEIAWRAMDTRSGPRLSLEWREYGVPVVDGSPARVGFGRELIERGLPYELDATTSLEFAQGGARAMIEMPLTERIAFPDDLDGGKSL